MAITVVEITSLKRIQTLLERQGVDPASVILDSTLDPVWLGRSEGFIPLPDMLSFYQAAADVLSDPHLGLTVALGFEPSDYGMIGHLYKVQPTFNDALDMLERYYNQFLADDLRLEVLRLDDGTHLRFGFAADHVGLQLLKQELVAINHLSIARYAPEPIIPIAVCLEEPAPDEATRERYRQVFGIDVTFDAETTEIVQPSEPLARPNPTADPRLARLLLEAADAHLARRREAAGEAHLRLRLEGCTVDLRHGVVHRDGREIALTTKERELLLYFSERANQVVTHDQLERDVWQLGKSVVSHAPAVAIRRLRQKIEPKPRRPVNLVTVFGEGWRLTLLEGSIPPPG